MFRGVNKLLPGHFLLVEKGNMAIRKYWELDISEDRSLSEMAYTEAFDELLRDVVRDHLIGDVPWGIFLSSGIDSAAILAQTCRVLGKPPKTFSIGFEDRSHSELPGAKTLADHFGTDHHEFTVSPDVKDILPRLVWHADEPLADSSAIPTYYLSRMTRENVKVALSGDGGDELFAGYLTYQADKAAVWFRRIPEFLRKFLFLPLVRLLPVSSRKVSFDYMAKRFVEGSLFDPLRAHYWWNGTFGETEKKGLLRGDVLRSLQGTDTLSVFRSYFNSAGKADMISRYQYVDLKLLLADDYLVKVDRMSMANSLEVRPPLLDHRLVEFVAKMPVELKLRRWSKKYLLKKSMAAHLPEEVLKRKKQGFSVPIHNWLRRELKDMMLDELSPSRIRWLGYFNEDCVEGLIRNHLAGKVNIGFHLYGLLVFSLWHRIFIENSTWQ